MQTHSSLELIKPARLAARFSLVFDRCSRFFSSIFFSVAFCDTARGDITVITPFFLSLFYWNITTSSLTAGYLPLTRGIDFNVVLSGVWVTLLCSCIQTLINIDKSFIVISLFWLLWFILRRYRQCFWVFDVCHQMFNHVHLYHV